MLDRESPIASAVVEMRSGRVLSPSGAASAHEILELLGAIAPDVLGKQHSVALASLFERLAGADPAAEPQDEFREVMLISSRMAFVIQR
ncbi:MAG TPA: hypothetical protein VJT73_19340, partial [Polyangiaceae bacterium]|nr:hypothetical protein [Polyangiaceae bacterium]